MKRETLKNAVDEAKRFIVRARELNELWITQYSTNPSKQSSAVKRASLDLTRKLADLRAGR